MKKLNRLLALGLAAPAIAALALAACAQSGGGSEEETGTLRVTIAGLPANMTDAPRAIVLTVSGSGMEEQSFSYTAVPSSVSAEVPAGAGRRLTLRAYTGPDYPSALLCYEGTAAADIAAGKATDLTLDMKAGDMKLVVPDHLNGRLVVMDDMSGSGWVSKTAADFGLPANCFMPYAVDVDAQGNVYAANYVLASGTETVPFLMKITDLKKNTYEGFLPYTVGSSARVNALAIDRGRNFLYFTQYLNEEFPLQMIDLADGAKTNFGAMGMYRIDGLAVDAEGSVYASGQRYDQEDLKNAICKFKITASGGGPQAQLVGTRFLDWGFGPRGLLAKDGYLLVTSGSPYNGSRLFKLDQSLLSAPVACGAQIDYAAATAYTAAKGLFYGPAAFIARGNRATCLIDDDFNNYQALPFDANRIVSFDDAADWSGWSALRGGDAGKAPFKFYITP